MADTLFSDLSVTGRSALYDGVGSPVQKAIRPQIAFDKWFIDSIANESPYSSSPKGMDRLLGQFTFDWSQLQNRVADAEGIVEDDEEFIEDYSYMVEASLKAAYAKPIEVNREDLQFYEGLSDYVYTLDVDYDEE